MLRVARRYRFSASHRLHSDQLSEEENERLFGKCNNPHGHGHDYAFEVIVRGDVDPATGLLVDVPGLDELVRREVLAVYEHKYMNEEIEVFREVPPTTEQVARDIHRRLAEKWHRVSDRGQELEGVRVYETRRNIVETGTSAEAI